MSEEDIQNVEGETVAEDAPAVSLDAINQNVVRSIPITLNVEVGKAKLKLKELMSVAQGTVLELDRSVGELMDIKVNDLVIAKGEVVTVENNKLGIRVLEIVSPMERIRDV
ncbi:FliM/FliN family flagellar motor switch protein [Gammaproteobacteria bacterium]|nr:FliM/FliN family flagellar motor switch protein [Gammaproteobacteria bacterium]